MGGDTEGRASSGDPGGARKSVASHVRGRVDRVAAADGGGGDLELLLEQARGLVARWEGFRDWVELVTRLGT